MLYLFGFVAWVLFSFDQFIVVVVVCFPKIWCNIVEDLIKNPTCLSGPA